MYGYKKILVPFDGAEDMERLTKVIKGHLAPEGVLVLSRVIDPKGADVGQIKRDLKGFLDRNGGSSDKLRFEVVRDTIVSRGILELGKRERAQIIVIDENRKGLAKLVKSRIAVDTDPRASIEVKLFSSGQVVGV